MNVLSLFDGMSCGRIALERANIPVTSYHSCEIDKYAITVSGRNYPQIVQSGSVVGYVPEHSVDLLIGGSPCQGFSFAGNGLAFNDPRSKLFFEYVRILKLCREKNQNVKFLLENVRMKKEYLDIISDQFGVRPVRINSSLVSAQNRVRFYWANFPITQPEDRGILLKDILEHGVVGRDKSYCIDANYFNGGSEKQYKEKSRRQLVTSASERRLMDHELSVPSKIGEIKGGGIGNRIYDQNAKGDSLCASSGGTAGAANMLVEVYEKPHGFNYGGFSEKEKFPTLRECTAHNYAIREDLVYRKLTVTECERLQTVPDGYTAGVSNAQRYKMLGNGWTVDVISHIFRGL